MRKGYEYIPKDGLRPLNKLKEYKLPAKYVCNNKGDVYIHDKSIPAKKINGVVCIVGKKMKPFITKLGYVEFVLTNIHGRKKHIQGQRIVALSFIKNPKNLPHVNHKDGNRSNNNKSNLEWSTISDNNKHAYRVLGRQPHNKGKRRAANGKYVKRDKAA